MPIQTEMIELKGEGFWMIVNRRDIRLIQMIEEKMPYLDHFKIVIFYYGEDEPMLALDQRFTKQECIDFVSKFNQ